MSEHEGTVPKPSWKQRFARFGAIAALVIMVLLAFQTGVVRLSLPGAVDPNTDPRIEELETALTEQRSAAEEAATQHSEEARQLREKLTAAETELARLRPIVARYQEEFDAATADRLATELQDAKSGLSELARRYADHALLLADVNSALGAAASAAGELDLARDFLDHWEKFQRDKNLVEDALSKLSPHLAPVQQVASGDIGNAGEARVRMEAGRAELERAVAALELGTTRLAALVQETQGFSARADNLRAAWSARNPGETLTGPTARELISEFDQSETGQQLAARQAVWKERLARLTGQGGLVQIPAGTTLENVVRSSGFANYIAEFERTYADTEARKRYLGHLSDGNWVPSPAVVEYIQNPPWKSSKGPQWVSNSLGLPTTTFALADWRYLMGNSRTCKFPEDADFKAELDYFTENFVAMVVADVGPNGEPALPFEE